MNRKLIVFSRHARAWLSLFLVFGMGDGRAALEDFSEQSITLDVPVVLSASRLRQPLSDAPNAVTVIDRAMIKASGFRNIADLFNLVPGMYVSYFNGWRPIVSYRGATDEYTRRMQVLVDGRSVYLQPFNTVDWEDLPLLIDDIERIEIVRGPAATSYGSNSIMGAINITTRDASAQRGATVSITRGNAGISDAVAHFGSSGEHWDYRLTFGKRSDNGFNFPKPPSPYYYFFFDGYNNSSATHIANLRSNYHPNAIDSLDFQMGYSNGVGAEGDPTNPFLQPRNTKKDSGYQQLTWLRTLDQHNDIQLKYYHISRNSISESFTLPVNGVRYPKSDNFHTHRHDLELQHTLQTGADNRVVWGMAARHESENDPSMFLSPQDLRQSRLFAHDEWRISPPLVLNGGAMLEDDGMGNKKLSPRLALNYHLTPEQTLRTSISVAYRNPSLVEQASYKHYQAENPILEWKSSGGLRSERTLSREIGYVGNFQNGISVDARVYNDQVGDIIFLDEAKVSPDILIINGNGVVYDFRNEITARYTGLETTVKYRWKESGLTFNYAHQMVSGALFVTPGPVVSGVLSQWMQRWNMTVPLNSGSLLYDTKLNGGFSLSAGYYQQGAVWVLVGTDQQPLNRRVDMRIAKQFKSTEKIGGGEIALVVQNAFQNKSIGYSVYSFDRRAHLTATVNF